MASSGNLDNLVKNRIAGMVLQGLQADTAACTMRCTGDELVLQSGLQYFALLVLIIDGQFQDSLLLPAYRTRITQVTWPIT